MKQNKKTEQHPEALCTKEPLNAVVESRESAKQRLNEALVQDKECRCCEHQEVSHMPYNIYVWFQLIKISNFPERLLHTSPSSVTF